VGAWFAVPQLGTLDQLCRAFGLSPEELGFEQAIAIKRRTTNKTQQQPSTSLPLSQLGNTNIDSVSTPDHFSTPYEPMVYDIAHRHPDHDTGLQQARRSLTQMNLIQYKRDGAFGLSRRQAIVALIGTPAAVFGVAETAQETLLHQKRCWLSAQ